MNKKLIQTIICIGAVLSFASIAQAETVVYLNESEKSVQTVSSGFEAGEIGTIMVLMPGDDMSKTDISTVTEENIKDKLYYMQTAAADAYGNLTFNFKLDEDMTKGAYAIRIFGAESDKNDLEKGEFFYVSQTDINKLVADIKAEKEFADCINKLIKYISFPEEYLGDGTADKPNDKYRAKIAEVFLRNKRAASGYDDYTTLKKDFYYSAAEVLMISNEKDFQKALGCLKLTEDALPENAEANIEEISKNMSQYSVASVAQYKTAIAQAAAIAEINKLDRSALEDGLDKYKDLLGFANDSSYVKFAALGADAKMQVCAKIAQTGFTSPKSITDAIKNALDGTGNKGSSSSSGNSSGKGSINLNTSVIPVTGGTQNSIAKCNFKDLDGFDWAKTAIYMLYEKEVISGKSEEAFAPADFVTRAEFLRMAMEAFDLTEDGAKCTMSDVSENDWFYKYVASGEEKEIINGDNGAFRPNDKITRQDIAVILDKIIEAAGIRPDIKDEEISFVDEDKISDYAKDSVSSMCQYGFINGDDNNMIRANDNATRAEAAVLIYRVYIAK